VFFLAFFINHDQNAALGIHGFGHAFHDQVQKTFFFLFGSDHIPDLFKKVLNHSLGLFQFGNLLLQILVYIIKDLDQTANFLGLILHIHLKCLNLAFRKLVCRSGHRLNHGSNPPDDPITHQRRSKCKNTEPLQVDAIPLTRHGIQVE